eukprot:1191195-Prorocentrum_minimum.AAC.5
MSMPSKHVETPAGAAVIAKEQTARYAYARTAGFSVRQMWCDRPFLMYIVDKDSAAVLAMCKVEHPVFNLDHRMEAPETKQYLTQA